MPAIRKVDGIPVVDARRPLQLHIIKHDCRAGDPKKPATCAAARAIKREMKAVDCRVHLSRVYIRTPKNQNKWLRYKTPRAMRTEIIAFDRGGQFEPGQYTLEVLSPSERTGKGRHGSTPKYKQARYNPNRKMRKSPTVVKHVRNSPFFV